MLWCSGDLGWGYVWMWVLWERGTAQALNVSGASDRTVSYHSQSHSLIHRLQEPADAEASVVLSSGRCAAFPRVTVVKPHPRRLPACRRWLVLCRSASKVQALGPRAVPFPPRPRLPCVPPSPVTDTHAHASFTLVTSGPSVSGKSHITQAGAGVGLEQERREASGCLRCRKRPSVPTNTLPGDLVTAQTLTP